MTILIEMAAIWEHLVPIWALNTRVIETGPKKLLLVLITRVDGIICYQLLNRHLFNVTSQFSAFIISLHLMFMTYA